MGLMMSAAAGTRSCRISCNCRAMFANDRRDSLAKDKVLQGPAHSTQDHNSAPPVLCELLSKYRRNMPDHARSKKRDPRRHEKSSEKKLITIEGRTTLVMGTTPN